MMGISGRLYHAPSASAGMDACSAMWHTALPSRAQLTTRLRWPQGLAVQHVRETRVFRREWYMGLESSGEKETAESVFVWLGGFSVMTRSALTCSAK